jgi:hypothetical protein
MRETAWKLCLCGFKIAEKEESRYAPTVIVISSQLGNVSNCSEGYLHCSGRRVGISCPAFLPDIRSSYLLKPLVFALLDYNPFLLCHFAYQMLVKYEAAAWSSPITLAVLFFTVF